MNQFRPYRFVLLIAALMLAVTSFASAKRMAPSPQLSTFIAMGGTLDDLCGDDLIAHTGDCPFCHVTADARSVRPAGHIWEMTPKTRAMQLAALTLGDRGDRSPWTARAPPLRA